ncbi:unnamed protein product [Tuber aestivum]|uniref:C2H2-type domain-containing protein n=1 Tax=Tuber aestivum TaxID=59557 RepID=A0A292PXC9_9PEZI|nr:unnamed protein product [Tuber aestivum]
MGSMQSPPATSDINAIFDSFINKDCLLGEAPDTLNSQNAIFRGNPPQQQQPLLQQELPPPSSPQKKDAHPHQDLILKFSESHFHDTKTTDLPLWADPSDLFNFDLATPHTTPANDLLATTNEPIPQAPSTSVQPTPANPTTSNPPRSPTHHILPPTPLFLPSSTTTSSTSAAPPPPTTHPTLTPTPAAATPPSVATPSPKPRPKLRPRKAFSCTSTHCPPDAATKNPETAHHHHHKDPKHRFCCRYEGCTSCTSYTTRKDRNRHEASKHSKQHLVCDVCGHTTARKDNMTGHVRSAHPEGWEVVMERITGVKVKIVMGLL